MSIRGDVICLYNSLLVYSDKKAFYYNFYCLSGVRKIISIKGAFLNKKVPFLQKEVCLICISITEALIN